MLRVRAIEGEPTCYEVESMELRCVNPDCSKLHRRAPDEMATFTKKQQSFLRSCGVLGTVLRYLKKIADKGGLREGDQCKKCGAALEIRWHRVDIADCNLNGACGCEWFQMHLRKELDKLPEAEQGLGHHRCGHIDAARDFALDLSLRAHQFERGETEKQLRELHKKAWTPF